MASWRSRSPPAHDIEAGNVSPSTPFESSQPSFAPSPVSRPATGRFLLRFPPLSSGSYYRSMPRIFSEPWSFLKARIMPGVSPILPKVAGSGRSSRWQRQLVWLKRFWARHYRVLVGVLAFICSVCVMALLLMTDPVIDKANPKNGCAICHLLIKKFHFTAFHLSVGLLLSIILLLLLYVLKDGCCRCLSPLWSNFLSMVLEIAVSAFFTMLSLRFTDRSSAQIAAFICVYTLCVCSLASIGTKFGFVDGAVSLLNYGILEVVRPEALRVFLLCLSLSAVNVVKYYCLRKGGEDHAD